jgi:hypothetical protein
MIRSETVILEIYGGIGLSLEDTEHNSTVTTPSFTDISSNATQKIDENLFYLSAGVSADWPISDYFNLNFETGLDVGLLDSGLESEQRNVCGLCGATDQNFVIAVQDDASDIFIGARADAGLTYKVGERVGLGVNGGLFWRDRSGFAVNPETGDDLFVRNIPTELGFGDVFGVHFGVHVQTWW